MSKKLVQWFFGLKLYIRQTCFHRQRRLASCDKLGMCLSSEKGRTANFQGASFMSPHRCLTARVGLAR